MKYKLSKKQVQCENNMSTKLSTNNKMRPNNSSYVTLISYTNKISTKKKYNKSTNGVHNEKLRINY